MDPPRNYYTVDSKQWKKKTEELVSPGIWWKGRGMSIQGKQWAAVQISRKKIRILNFLYPTILTANLLKKLHAFVSSFPLSQCLFAYRLIPTSFLAFGT